MELVGLNQERVSKIEVERIFMEGLIIFRGLSGLSSLLHCMKSQIRHAKSGMTLLSVAQTQTKRGVPSYDGARRLKSRKGQ